MSLSKPTKAKKYERFCYTEEALQDAVASVKDNNLSINKASRRYGIPKTTLLKKVNGAPLERRMGPQTVLFPHEEERIKNWILSKAQLGFPMHPEEVKNAVQKILKETKRPNPFTDDRPGRKWMNLFLKGHPDIVLKNAEVISKGRAAVTEEGIRNWFAQVKAYLKEEKAEDILDDPSRIFNLDETGVQVCPKTGKVLGQRGERNNYTIATGQEKQSITVLCCYSASSQWIDPLIVYPHLRIPGSITSTMPVDAAVGRSPLGWMIGATFYEYMANVFYEQLVEDNVKFPVLVFLDGHKSHISMELHEFCVSKRILLV